VQPRNPHTAILFANLANLRPSTIFILELCFKEFSYNHAETIDIAVDMRFILKDLRRDVGGNGTFEGFSERY
jgi:hypothetical protein